MVSTPTELCMSGNYIKVSAEKESQHLEKMAYTFLRLLDTLNDLKKNYRLFIVSNCEEGYIQSLLREINWNVILKKMNIQSEVG